MAYAGSLVGGSWAGKMRRYSAVSIVSATAICLSSLPCIIHPTFGDALRGRHQDTTGAQLSSRSEAHWAPSAAFFEGTTPTIAGHRESSLASGYPSELRQLQQPVRLHSLPPQDLTTDGTEDLKREQESRSRGRLAKARKTIGRWASKAKKKLRWFWKAAKRKAGAAKAGLRRAAAKVYSKLPRIPWRRRDQTQLRGPRKASGGVPEGEWAAAPAARSVQRPASEQGQQPLPVPKKFEAGLAGLGLAGHGLPPSRRFSHKKSRSTSTLGSQYTSGQNGEAPEVVRALQPPSSSLTRSSDETSAMEAPLAAQGEDTVEAEEGVSLPKATQSPSVVRRGRSSSISTTASDASAPEDVERKGKRTAEVHVTRSSDETSAMEAPLAPRGEDTVEAEEGVSLPKATQSPSVVRRGRASSISTTASDASAPEDVERKGKRTAEVDVERSRASIPLTEQWFDALETVEPEEFEFATPASTPIMTRKKVPEKVQPKETEEGYEFATNLESSTTIEPTEGRESCINWERQLPSDLKLVAANCSGFCALWTQFAHRGRLSTDKADFTMLAAMLSSKINAARELSPEQTDIHSQQLRMLLRLAKEQDHLVRVHARTDSVCWLTSMGGVYAHANPEEVAVMNKAASSPSTVFSNPVTIAEKLRRLMDMALDEVPRCIEATQRETQARKELQKALQEESERLRQALHEVQEKEELTESTTEQIVRELALLRTRDACSIEALYLISSQAEGIKSFIVEYNQDGKRWWRAQWPFKLDRCRRPSKGSSVVPPAIARTCRDFEASPRPESAAEVTSELLWLWEVGDVRE